jgi:hypothetical protein
MPLGSASKSIALASPFRIGGWLGECESNIRVHTKDAVNFASGATAFADVFLTGPLREFVPVGRVGFSELQANLPSGPMNFSRAEFSLTREMLWIPTIDLYGVTGVGAYQVSATAWGPLGEQQLRLKSVPEMSPDQIALLLGAGLTPEADARSAEFRTEKTEKPQELPPPQIGCTWSVE